MPATPLAAHSHGPLCTCGTGHAPTDLTRAAFLRRAGIVSLGLLGSGALLAGCGNASSETGASTPAADDRSSTDRALKVGYLPITDATPLLVAHANGLYEEQDLEVPKPVLLRSWPALAEAFQSGGVDAVHILMPLAVQLRFDRKFPVKVVAWNHTNGSALTVRNDLDHVEDLAGGTIGIPGWFSIHNIALQILLRKAGLEAISAGKPSKADRTVKLIVMAPPDMPPALAQGSISGYIVADPFNAAAEVNGIGKVLRFTGDVWRDHACCVVAVREELIQERPDVAKGFVNAVVGGQAAARKHPVAAAKTLTSKGYLPQPEPVVNYALTHGKDPKYMVGGGAVQHPEWEQRRIDFRGFPFASYTGELIDQLRKTVVDGDLSFLDGLDGDRAHRELVDDRLVRQAIDDNGGPAAFGLPASLERREEIAP